VPAPLQDEEASIPTYCCMNSRKRRGGQESSADQGTACVAERGSLAPRNAPVSESKAARTVCERRRFAGLDWLPVRRPQRGLPPRADRGRAGSPHPGTEPVQDVQVNGRPNRPRKRATWDSELTGSPRAARSPGLSVRPPDRHPGPEGRARSPEGARDEWDGCRSDVARQAVSSRFASIEVLGRWHHEDAEELLPEVSAEVANIASDEMGGLRADRTAEDRPILFG
jgi:hypothetical protein